MRVSGRFKAVSITGGKGGVGKTNIAVNLGVALCERGQRVVLLDADLGLANVDLIAGLSGCDHSLVDLLERRASLRDVMVEGPAGLQVLPGGSGVLRMERLTHDRRVQLMVALRDIADDFDVLLIDTGAGLSENVVFFNAAADGVLVVTTPEPTALTDAYALIKVMTAHHDVANVSVVVNQVDRPSQGAEAHAKLDDVARRFLGRGVDYAGHVSRDLAIAEAVRERMPALLVNPQSLASVDLRALGGRFDQLFAAPAASAPDLWQRLAAREGPPSATHAA